MPIGGSTVDTSPSRYSIVVRKTEQNWNRKSESYMSLRNVHLRRDVTENALVPHTLVTSH